MQTVIRRAFALCLLGLLSSLSSAEEKKPKPEFPPFAEVSKGYEEWNSGGEASFWKLWLRESDSQLLAELPKDFASKRFYIVPTVEAGDTQAGVYSIWHHLVGQESRYHYWKRHQKTVALMVPNLEYRTSGDDQSKAATSRVYTDSVILTAPILCMGPGGGPVVDLDQILIGKSGVFFGDFTKGANTALASIDEVKAFPYNIELSVTLPRMSGQLATLHYSVGMPPKSEGFQPREADRRVGFYYTNYTDRAKNDGESQVIRYAHRWHLEKADPKLKLSPPKKPIVYYIEHTTPIRYRRWVQAGVLAWNKAFEKVGILGAIEVRQQDASTGAHMDVDPADLRHSFVRWTNAHMGFAIGPNHAHPETGEIFEADIVMDEAFVGGWAATYLSTQLASTAMASMDRETVDWLGAYPDWDPRVRLAPPSERAAAREYALALAQGHADPALAPSTMGPEVWRQTDASQASQGAYCRLLTGQAADLAFARMALAGGFLDGLPGAEEADNDDSAGGDAEGEREMLDGVPEEFIGPMLRAVIMHEVGHTLGLMHNWKGSAQFSFEEINSESFRGQKSMSSTVMDYLPTNIVVPGDGLVQGDYDTVDLGAYDYWAIEWGYTFGDESKVAVRSSEPGHAFMAEDGQSGPDPQAKVWDLGENSLDAAESDLRLIAHMRERMLDKMVRDGQSWAKARTAFGSLLSRQLRALTMSGNWIGGAHVRRSFKGDPGADVPFEPVATERQRRALQIILEHGFRDEAFGLNPEILAKLVPDNWYDVGFDTSQDWAIQDSVLGIQASLMTLLLSPTRLRRIEDNLLRMGDVDDALTVPELLAAVRAEVWSELSQSGSGYSETKPMISALRRNLQGEHLDRLIGLATGRRWPNASGNAVRSLARSELQALLEALSPMPVAGADAYTRAHLTDARARIESALAASYVLTR